ncbi:MAG: aminotransferase class I/II-fold pyridoxal phosphate-dependent enzyme [Clostridia bacterium]|nr:aminotransferase class I/II-fold pyridoxal phosphate-dependent enzyme [Clostridia bacterium]
MKLLIDYSAEQLALFEADVQQRYDSFLSQGINLNMARGKPAPEQLDLSADLFSLTEAQCGYLAEDGTDCRNYGFLYGIPECRRLFGDILGVPSSNVIACGSSSLNLMFDYIAQCFYKGVGGHEPWSKNENKKFIAVVPGYDRHFAIAEYFGLEMINVPMTDKGPDMDMIEEIIKDSDVKGMFCVPKYSNPDGITYSDETVRRLAAMKPAAGDFRVIWDAAYVVHDLYDESDSLLNVFEEAKKYGNEDNFVLFTSTSKISYAGAGVSAMAASDANFKEISSRLTLQTISYDKINQLKHCYFYKTVDDVKAQMKKHASIMRPKFDTVLEVLEKELSGLGVASWNHPKGGYFISLDVNTGSAKYVGELCKKAGLTLTTVGATYPYGNDPDDKNIRLAPSYPSVEELRVAAEIVCVAVKLAACKELNSKETDN